MGSGRIVMVNWWLLFGFCLAFALPLQIQAQSEAEVEEFVQDGFSAEVAVNGQTPDEQISAYRVAMRIILLQNSGDKSLLNNPSIQQALIEADNYIDASSYRVPGPDDRLTRATPLTPKVRRSNEATHLLRVHFNQPLIAGLISDQRALEPEADPDAEPEVPVSALVWLLIDDGNGEHRIGGPIGSNVVERVREIAGGVGQRIVFPEQDALDLQLLTSLDMQSGDQQRVLGASGRYDEAVVLVGVLTRSEGRSWLANWSRYFEGTVLDFNDTAGSLDQALQQGISWLAEAAQPTDILETTSAADSAGLGNDTDTGNSEFGRSNYATTNSGTIWVGRLQSLEAYATLMKMINEMESVELVYPAEVLPTGILFSISPRYALNDVTSLLAGVSWLRPSLQTNSSLEQASSSMAQASVALPLARIDFTYEYIR